MNMTMIGPSWLATIFGVIMLAAAAYAAGRLLTSLRGDRITDYEVDAHHLLMGVSMAGMLIPTLNIVTAGPSTTIWIVVWVLVTLWFAISVVRRATRGGRHFRGHHLPHLVMSAAMLYMLAASAIPMSGANMKSMSGMGGGGLDPWPTVDALFLVFMAGYAVVVIDRFPLLAIAAHISHATSTPATQRSVLAPGMAGVQNITMAITMGYMLTMMFS